MLLSASPPLRGESLQDELLAPYTSWHVGGTARQIYKPADLADLAHFLMLLPPNEPLTWLGLGSNVLIPDNGIPGTVIYTQGCLKELVLQENQFIRAEAGVTCAKLAKFCAKQQFAQGAFFAGIPGTVGGALAMNAGAFGGETWTYVVAVETMDRNGIIRNRMPNEFQIAYREVKRPPDEWFVAGIFGFPRDEISKAEMDIRELLRKRNASQPIGEFSCGSVFRNPLPHHAAHLIESCGLKGTQIGGAWVSTKHANFIINGGEATSCDIQRLVQFIQETVKQKTGIELTPEFHLLGKEEFSRM